MNVAALLDMVADTAAARVAVTVDGQTLTYGELAQRAASAASWIAAQKVATVGYLGVNSQALPILSFGAARAGVPFTPLNYRWMDAQIGAAARRLAPGVLVVEADAVARVDGVPGARVVAVDDLLFALPAYTDTDHMADSTGAAVLLFTSGTSGDPKIAVLRHDHLTSYILESVDFLGAEADEANLVSVPPYHVAGLAALLSSVFAARRIVYLPTFTPQGWIDLAEAERVTHAMVVPTMLSRIVDELERRPEIKLAHLVHLSYGGGRMPHPLIEAVMHRLPHVDLVNAYGLTETSSTISILSPSDHRRATQSDDPAVRQRLGSVGRPIPSVEVEIRSPDGLVLGPGELGEIWVKGPQIAGEYVGLTTARGTDGWLRTKDAGWLDAEGYLFVDGRLDDIIVRGGENISPGEVEDVLVAHPAIAEAAVIGVPDDEWGESLVAIVVAQGEPEVDDVALQGWVRGHLRSSKVPSRVEFRPALPYNDMGKLLRRDLRAELNVAST